jgi:hypothetical protein
MGGANGCGLFEAFLEKISGDICDFPSFIDGMKLDILDQIDG